MSTNTITRKSEHGTNYTRPSGMSSLEGVQPRQPVITLYLRVDAANAGKEATLQLTPGLHDITEIRLKRIITPDALPGVRHVAIRKHDGEHLMTSQRTTNGKKPLYQLNADLKIASATYKDPVGLLIGQFTVEQEEWDGSAPTDARVCIVLECKLAYWQ